MQEWARISAEFFDSQYTQSIPERNLAGCWITPELTLRSQPATRKLRTSEPRTAVTAVTSILEPGAGLSWEMHEPEEKFQTLTSPLSAPVWGSIIRRVFSTLYAKLDRAGLEACAEAQRDKNPHL